MMKMQSDDLVPVQEFMRESLRNLEIGNAIFEQYEAARAGIVEDLFERLKGKLKLRLPDWKFEHRTKMFLEPWGAFDLSKPHWKRRYLVRIEAYRHGQSMGFGVWRDASALGGIGLCGKLLEEVKKHYASAKGRSWFEAEVAMTSPANCWKSPQVEIVVLLVNLAEIAEPFVERLISGTKVD